MSFDYKILGKDAPSRARRIVSKGNTILSTVRPNLKAFAFAEKDYNDTVFSTGFAILMPKDINALLPKLLYIYFMNMESLMQQIIDKMPKGQYPSINKADIESFMIPLPPLDIQQKIVDECKKVDEEYLDSKRKIETLVNQIDKIYNDSISTNTKVVKLSDICNMRAGKFVAAADIKDVADEKFKYPCYGGNGMRGYTDTMTNEGEYTIIGRQGALCGNVCTAKGQFHATEHAVVVYPNPDTDPVWLRYHLEKMNLNQYATGTAQPGLSVQKILELQCSVPLFETQKKVAEAIKKYEQDIQEAEEFCRSSYSRKQAILDKYLK
jgi:restriction endonuclease S subunit